MVAKTTALAARLGSPCSDATEAANAALAVALSGSGKLLALGCVEGTIEIRDLDQNTTRSLHGHFQRATHLTISADRRRLAAIIEPRSLKRSQAPPHLLSLWELLA